MEHSSTPTSGSDKKPEATFRFGKVSAAVFRDATDEGAAMYVSLRRSYKDASGVWKHPTTLGPGDLLPAALALTKCYEYIASASKEQSQ